VGPTATTLVKLCFLLSTHFSEPGESDKPAGLPGKQAADMALQVAGAAALELQLSALTDQLAVPVLSRALDLVCLERCCGDAHAEPQPVGEESLGKAAAAHSNHSTSAKHTKSMHIMRIHIDAAVSLHNGGDSAGRL